MNTTDPNSERWAAVPGWEGLYEVSDLGRFRRSDVVALLKPEPFGEKGYLRIGLWRNNRRATKQLHRVVLEAFVGPCPSGMQACHGDGDPTNNRLENLRWDTPSANTLDTVKHGTHHAARKTHCKYEHEFTPENTMIRTNKATGASKRKCRECNRRTTRAFRARQASEVSA